MFISVASLSLDVFSSLIQLFWGGVGWGRGRDVSGVGVMGGGSFLSPIARSMSAPQ